MDRKRSVLTASGISALLVVGSTTFAFANGIFVGKPVDRVGDFQAIQARLVPAAKPAPTSAPAGAPPRERSAEQASPAPAATMERTAPAVVVRRTSEPKGTPAVQAATTPVISHSNPSAVMSSTHDDDDQYEEYEHDDAEHEEYEHESGGEHERDD